MAKKASRRTRRTAEQMIKDLERKIAEVKARAERKKVQKDPALRHISGAVRSIDKAVQATSDAATRKALEDARTTLGACLSLNGVEPKKGVLTPRRAAAKVEPKAVLAYLKDHPGSSGEQIAEAVGADTASVRPVLKGLIAEGQAKSRGKARGTRYAAV